MEWSNFNSSAKKHVAGAREERKGCPALGQNKKHGRVDEQKYYRYAGHSLSVHDCSRPFTDLVWLTVRCLEVFHRVNAQIFLLSILGQKQSCIVITVSSTYV